MAVLREACPAEKSKEGCSRFLAGNAARPNLLSFRSLPREPRSGSSIGTTPNRFIKRLLNRSCPEQMRLGFRRRPDTPPGFGRYRIRTGCGEEGIVVGVKTGRADSEVHSLHSLPDLSSPRLDRQETRSRSSFRSSLRRYFPTFDFGSMSRNSM